MQRFSANILEAFKGIPSVGMPKPMHNKIQSEPEEGIHTHNKLRPTEDGLQID